MVDLYTTKSQCATRPRRAVVPQVGLFMLQGVVLLACGLWALSPSANAGKPAKPPLAKELVELGNYWAAIPLLQAHIAECDSCTVPRLLLAEALAAVQRDQERALALLEPLGTLPRAIFLRGELLRGLYRFEEAREQYLKYLALPNAEKATAQLAHRRLAECQNALQLAGAAFNPKFLDVRHIHKDSLVSAVDDPALSYSWIPTPASLQSEYDQQPQRGEIMAYPRRIVPSTRLFYTSRTSPGGSTDIYYIEKLADDLWARPVSAGYMLNSERDEAAPLLRSDGAVLYFSSEGHYGMGGMDIFRSKWDANTGRWLPPENLGFPFNSPYDDYLLVVPEQQGTMLIASRRDTGPDSLRLFLLEYSPTAPGQALKGAEAISRYARFQYNAPAGEVAPATTATVPPRPTSKPGSRKRHRDVESDPEYKRELAAGFAQQKRADTLRTELTKLREALWDVRTAEQRKQLEAKIVPVERDMLTAQRKADSHFATASLIEQEYIVGKRTLRQSPEGQGAFAEEDHEFLHQAQIAKSAFQPAEISTLSASAKLLVNFYAEAKSIVNLRRTAGNNPQREQGIEALARGFVNRYEKSVHTVQGIYSDCLAVALMKSNRNESALVQSAEQRAREMMRNAGALRRNNSENAQWQTSFDALLLDALANQFFEEAYSYAWGMSAYRARVEKRIAQYEALVNQGGEVAPSEAGRSTSQSEATPQPPQAAPTEPVATPAAQTPERAPEPAAASGGLRIESVSPYTTGTAIPKDAPMRKGVVYKLQLGAYSNPIDPEIFRGMVPISAETVGGGKITKYYAGEFATKEEAERGKQITAKCGFPDAFVVAWYDGRNVPIARAKSLEGTVVKTEARTQPSPRADTYRVLVGTFESPIPSYVEETLSILAPQREVTRQPAENGRWHYLVGGFKEKSHAERLRDNLLASGYTEAEVME